MDSDSQQQETAAIRSEISATSTSNLQPPLDETALLQELVAQFLAHDGYVETARAFAEEVATETAALQNGRDEPLKKYEVEEDREAINRNSKSDSSVRETSLTVQKSALPFWMGISTRLSNTPRPFTATFWKITQTSTSSSGVANS